MTSLQRPENGTVPASLERAPLATEHQPYCHSGDGVRDGIGHVHPCSHTHTHTHISVATRVPWGDLGYLIYMCSSPRFLINYNKKVRNCRFIFYFCPHFKIVFFCCHCTHTRTHTRTHTHTHTHRHTQTHIHTLVGAL